MCPYDSVWFLKKTHVSVRTMNIKLSLALAALFLSPVGAHEGEPLCKLRIEREWSNEWYLSV